MANSFRRIVTGHDAAGRAIVHRDDVLTPQPIASGDAEFQLVWTTPNVPVDLSAGDDGPVPTGLTLDGGSVIRIVDMLPGKASPMHRSFLIDCGVALLRELEFELDGGEVKRLGANDVVVQRGTNHLWRNSSANTVCRCCQSDANSSLGAAFLPLTLCLRPQGFATLPARRSVGF